MLTIFLFVKIEALVSLISCKISLILVMGARNNVSSENKGTYRICSRYQFNGKENNQERTILSKDETHLSEI